MRSQHLTSCSLSPNLGWFGAQSVRSTGQISGDLKPIFRRTHPKSMSSQVQTARTRVKTCALSVRISEEETTSCEILGPLCKIQGKITPDYSLHLGRTHPSLLRPWAWSARSRGKSSWTAVRIWGHLIQISWALRPWMGDSGHMSRDICPNLGRTIQISWNFRTSRPYPGAHLSYKSYPCPPMQD